MALTFGFFNSINADRLYDAHQISDFFEGPILDGVISGIGNIFACRAVTDSRISIDTGLGYFKGYYIYNDSIKYLNIPEDYYPYYPMTGISVLQNPDQTEYPVGNRLDLNGTVIEGLQSTSGEKFGDVYVVISLDEDRRLFTIDVIRVDDYNSEKDYIIAICHKTRTKFYVENLVGRIKGSYQEPNIIGAYLTTGLLRHGKTLWNLSVDADEAFSDFETLWKETIPDEYEDWLTTQEYYLYQSGQQYSRLTAELTEKVNTPSIITINIPRSSRSITVQDQRIVNNSIIDIYQKPNGLFIEDIIIQPGFITLKYKTAIVNHILNITVRNN